MPKMNISKLSDDDLQDMFTEAFETKVANLNGISSFECTSKRETGKPDMKMEVMIVGMAGSPTVDEYKNGKVNGADKITITREGNGSLDFVLVPKESVYLSVNDYIVVYRSV